MTEISDKYLTISKKTTGSFYDRKSRFISIAFPVSSEEQIKAHLKELRKEFYDAVHHCYAWEITAEKVSFRANDDGEPGGSAGMPIYNLIRSRNLTNILIVVVRYFGGVKLGVPGLINAYRQAGAEALASAEIIEKHLMRTFSVEFPYMHSNDVMRIGKKFSLVRLQESYADENCIMNFQVRASWYDTCRDSLEHLKDLTFNNVKEGEYGLA